MSGASTTGRTVWTRWSRPSWRPSPHGWWNSGPATVRPWPCWAPAFRRLIELDPTDAQAWARLGESLVRANDGQIGGDAEAAFREAVKHDPDQLGARFFLGEAALRRGDATTARAMWTPLIAALDPTDPRRIDLERRLPAGTQ